LRTVAITEGLVKWPRGFPASRVIVHFHPNKNSGNRNFRGAPAKRRYESRHRLPAALVCIELDSLRFAQTAMHHARDFQAAPANSEMIPRAAPPNMTSVRRAVR